MEFNWEMQFISIDAAILMRLSAKTKFAIVEDRLICYNTEHTSRIFVIIKIFSNTEEISCQGAIF